MNGRFKSYLGVGVAVIFAFIMIFSAILILKQPKYIETVGTIMSVSNTCTSDVCVTTVKFNAKGQEYTKDFQIGSPKVNTTVPIFFTEESPPNFSTSAPPSKRFAYILIFVAVLMVILSAGIFYYLRDGVQPPNVPDIANSPQLNQNLGGGSPPPPPVNNK